MKDLDLSKFKARIVKVDLSMAEHFLSFEKQPEPGKEGTNRRFSPEVVNNYAIDLLSGDWPFHHQGMGFKGYLSDGTAEFVDGGHRCRAIIQAATRGAINGDVVLDPNPDVFMVVMVTEGLDDEAVMAMDINKRRQPHDFLVMRGETNATLLASCVRLCMLYETVPWSAIGWKKARITPHMRQNYLEDNPGIRAAINEGARVGKVMTVSSAAAGFHLGTKAGIKEDTLRAFIESLAYGINLSEDDPARVLRELMKNARGNKKRYTRDEQLALFIKAFMKWVNGVPTKQMMFRTVGESAEAFPRYPS